jgi:hypothetical protein
VSGLCTRWRSASICAATCAVVLLTLARPTPAYALPDAIAGLVQLGSARVAARAFALAGDSVQAEHRYEVDGCTGFLAWSEGQGSDVDLVVYSPAGQALAEDRSALAYAYARLCAADGMRVQVAATTYTGQGQVHIVALAPAPESAALLFAGTVLAGLGPGASESERDVGELTPALGPDGKPLWGDISGIERLGYAPLSEAQWMAVTSAGAEGELTLTGGHCTRIEIQAPMQRGLVATVQLSSGELLHGQAPGRDRTAITACVVDTTRARVRVRPRVPRGVVGLRGFMHSLPVAPPPQHTRHAALAAQLELTFVAQSHGFTARHVEDVWLEPGQVAVRPLPILPEGCAALMLMPEESQEIDARWVSSAGELLALHEGRSSWHALYHCGRPDAASVRLRGRARAGRISVWVATPEGP